MKKRSGLWVSIMVIVSIFLAGVLVAQEQERGARGPGMRGPGGPGMGVAQNFNQIDRNSDGKLSKEEIAEWSWQRYAQADADSDGAISRKEADSMMPPPREGGPGGPGGFGGRPGGGGRMGGPQGGGTGAVESALANRPLPKSETEKQILTVLDDMDRNQRGGNMNVPILDGRILRMLTESLGAKHVVEIGTSNGYSGTWIALALKGTGGKLTTFEIDKRRAAMARENFKRAGVADVVTLVEGDAHQEVAKMKEPIDLMFLDADKEGYIDYLEKLLPQLRPGGLVVAHNITERQADPRYLKAITTNPELESLIIQAQGSGGISITMKKR